MSKNRIYVPTSGPHDWRCLLKNPISQWATGYSAKELAHSWEKGEGKFPDKILKVFNKSTNKFFHNIVPLFIFPEYAVYLDSKRAPSQNDIYVIAKAAKEIVSITVEGKCNEDFDSLVSEWLTADQGHNKGRKKRLAFLCNLFGIDSSRFQNVRYQLIHRTASALLEAERINARNAIMMIHSFSEDNDHFEDYVNFASCFGASVSVDSVDYINQFNGVNLYFSWINDKNPKKTTCPKCDSDSHNHFRINCMTLFQCQRCGQLFFPE